MIVRLKGVNRVRSKGRIYYYHRRSGARLPGSPGTPEFMAALQRLTTSATSTPSPGTLGGLVKSYRSSPEFAALSPRSREIYDKVFVALDEIGAMPLYQITTDWLYKLRDRMMVKRKRFFTNAMLQLLQSMFGWGVKRGHVKDNPVIPVDKVRRPRSAPALNRPWKPEELDLVLAEAPPWLRVPIALAAYTGLRQGDVLRVTWSAYDGRAFETRSQKTNVPTWVPAHSRLREILDATPRRSTQIVVGTRGRPLTRSHLTTGFFELLKRLREAGMVGPGLSFHGLRHTLGTSLAEAGATPATIASILGHSTTAMAEHYSRHADRRHLAEAAMKRLERR